MDPISWRLYYADTEFSSADGTWESAPENGVQVLMLYFDGYRQIIAGEDEYWLPGHTAVKYGSWLPTEEAVDEIQRRAMRDERP